MDEVDLTYHACVAVDVKKVTSLDGVIMTLAKVIWRVEGHGKAGKIFGWHMVAGA